MRFELEAEDRLGITQEILSIFTRQKWNLLARETRRFHIFVHFDNHGISLEIIQSHLNKIAMKLRKYRRS